MKALWRYSTIVTSNGFTARCKFRLPFSEKLLPSAKSVYFWSNNCSFFNDPFKFYDPTFNQFGINFSIFPKKNVDISKYFTGNAQDLYSYRK